MKRLLVASIIGFLLQTGYSQTDSIFEPKGSPIIQVFGNYDYDATQDAQKKYGFWFGRAHFGYEYQFSKQLSGKIILDAGRPTIVGQISVTDQENNHLQTTNTAKEGSYYTMTLKFASLEWKPGANVRFQAGGILQNHYITQEKFWGFRYLAETFQDRYYKMPSGDLGLIGYFSVSDALGFDLAITNGEGFRFDQDVYGDVKFATGIDFNPVNGLQTRLYYDHHASGNPEKQAVQQLYSFFAGYKFLDLFRIGGEYNYRQNHQHSANHNLFGFSIFGSYRTGKNTELFARYDKLQANRLPGDTQLWNEQDIGEAYIAGIHCALTKGVHVSLNYQAWQPENNELKYKHHLLLSFEYKL